jgi:aromatic ring hydroxylase
MVAGPLPDPDVSVFDHPVSSRNVEMETLTVFDNVFVPHERVFLAGEADFAGELALRFATFHRFTAVSYKLPMAELLLGCALAVAEHNGIGRASHVRDKIAHIALYGQLLRASIVAAVEAAHDLPCGLVLPDPAATSAGKYHFASGYHGVVQILQDLAGGLAITAPWEADLLGAETGPLVRKYLGGGDGSDPECRFRLFQLIRDLTASDFAGYNEVVTLHGEGSLRAQLIQLLAATDVEGARNAVACALEP